MCTVFGIIIDTFAELREHKTRKEEDMQNVCFICNIERPEFDRQGNGFEHHIHNDHWAWNYINLMAYVTGFRVLVPFMLAWVRLHFG